MKYKAFISYRHKEIDEVVARHIQKIIERYRVPRKIAKTIGNQEKNRLMPLMANVLRSTSRSFFSLVGFSTMYTNHLNPTNFDSERGVGGL